MHVDEIDEDDKTPMSRLSKECREVLVRSFTVAMSDNLDYNAEITFDILIYVATQEIHRNGGEAAQKGEF